MNSMQDALTEALEHPVTEIRRKGRQLQAGAEQMDRFWWGVLAYVAASAVLYRMYRGMSR